MTSSGNSARMETRSGRRPHRRHEIFSTARIGRCAMTIATSFVPATRIYLAPHRRTRRARACRRSAREHPLGEHAVVDRPSSSMTALRRCPCRASQRDFAASARLGLCITFVPSRCSEDLHASAERARGERRARTPRRERCSPAIAARSYARETEGLHRRDRDRSIPFRHGPSADDGRPCE